MIIPIPEPAAEARSIDVVVTQWIASLLGVLSAIAVSHAFGGGDRRTTLCILVVAGFAGRLSRKMRPTVTIRNFHKWLRALSAFALHFGGLARASWTWHCASHRKLV